MTNPIYDAGLKEFEEIFKKEHNKVYYFFNEITRLKSANARLIELLSQCSEYLDRGDYPENKTQYRLFRRCEQALKDSEI